MQFSRRDPSTILLALCINLGAVLSGNALAPGAVDPGTVDPGTRASPAPAREERQLPGAMRSAMRERPLVRVGQKSGDIRGADNRALQAAVDYVALLGGGTVEIGEGVYRMRDSLHLRSNVTVRGQGEKTVLRKEPCAASPLALDGDYGEEQITLVSGEGFQVGDGVAIRDDNSGGFHTTVARIIGKRGNTFAISLPLNADCMVHRKARAATVFPVVSGYHLQGARLENIAVDGNREGNLPLNGCRGAGIFLYRGFGTVLRGCTVRGYNGDGISFQQSNDVLVENCTSENNASLGLHPGSGSQRPVIRNCLARKNGTDGLFLCWRVRHGLFEQNQLIRNGRFGISIGHKDSDNILRKNIVGENGSNGVFFRNETEGMAPHRNSLLENIIENNGTGSPAAGIRIRGEPRDLVIRGNIIRDTREGSLRTQRTAILIEERAGDLTIEENQIEADEEIRDLRPGKSGS